MQYSVVIPGMPTFFLKRNRDIDLVERGGKGGRRSRGRGGCSQDRLNERIIKKRCSGGKHTHGCRGSSYGDRWKEMLW